MNAEITQNLTILIPSKERPNELSCLLKYFEMSEIKCKIVILETGNLYRSLLKNFPTLDIKLYEFGSDISFGKKLLKGAKLVETPLVCVCADDDLVLKEGMEKCVEFLLRAPEYSACQGYHALFEKREDDFYFYHILWFTPSLDSENRFERLQHLMTRYHPICWAVFRKEVLSQMMKQFPKVKTPLFFELYWSAMAAMVGKVKRLPTLYCLRTNDDMHPRGHPFYLFADSPEEFCKDYLAYRAFLEKILPGFKKNGKARRMLDLLHASFFYSAGDAKILQFVVQKAIEDPDLSILKPSIYNAIKIPVARFEEKESLLITKGAKKFHFTKKFMGKEPSNEVVLPENFHLKLVDELAKL